MTRDGRGTPVHGRREPMRAGDLLARLARSSSGARGSLLVAMLVVMTITSIFLSMAATDWSFIMRREREKELIFRGLQIARAIQQWQTHDGKAPPTTLEIMTKPPRPTLRRVFDDPMTARYDDEGNLVENTGQWILIGEGEDVPQGPTGPGTTTGPRSGSAPAQPSATASSRGTGRLGDKPQITAILGVHSSSDEPSIGQFQESGAEVPYADWKFRPLGPGRGGMEGGFDLPKPPGFGGFRTPGGPPVVPSQDGTGLPAQGTGMPARGPQTNRGPGSQGR